MNSFGTLFHDTIFFPDNSLTVNNIPDISLTCFKFPDISTFSRQVVTLNNSDIIRTDWVYLVGGAVVWSASVSCVGGGAGGGMTAAGTTATGCVGARFGIAAATVTRCASITVDSTRRENRGGGWLTDDWPPSPPSDPPAWWPRWWSNAWGKPGPPPPPRNGPLLRRGLHIHTYIAEWNFTALLTLWYPTVVCHLGVVLGLMHRWPGRFF